MLEVPWNVTLEWIWNVTNSTFFILQFYNTMDLSHVHALLYAHVKTKLD